MTPTAPFSKAVFTLAAATCGLLFLLHVATKVAFDRDLTIPEGSIVYSALALVQGGSLYRDYNHPPYATTAYTWLLYLCMAAFIWFLDLGVSGAYRCGRFLCFASTVTACLVAARLANRLERRRGISLLALFAPAFFGPLSPWGYTCRPDLLAVAWTLSGLWVITSSWGGFLLRAAAGGVCFWLALSAKQSALAGFLTGLWWCVQGQGWAAASVLLGTWLGLSGLSFLVVQAMCPPFLANVLGANAAPLFPEQAAELTVYYAFFNWPTLTAVMLPLVSVKSCSFSGPWRVYALVSFSVAVASAAKAGADLNYFLEPTFAFAILLPRSLSWLNHWRLSRYLSSGLATVVLWASFVRLLSWSGEISRPTAFEILSHLEQYGRPILFQESGLALRAGYPPLLLDCFNASYLWDAGKLNLDELVGLLAQKKIAAVVLWTQNPASAVRSVTWLPKPIVEQINSNYVLADLVPPDVWVFVPRSRERSGADQERFGRRE